MTRYVVLRLYSMGLTLVGLSVLVFLMLRLIPGTVVEQMIGADAIVSPAMVAELTRFFGLDSRGGCSTGAGSRRSATATSARRGGRASRSSRSSSSGCR